jgi:hypothetical protein
MMDLSPFEHHRKIEKKRKKRKRKSGSNTSSGDTVWGT